MKKSATDVVSGQEAFNRKLLGYSLTAGAALLLAPATLAQTYDITQFSTTGPGGFTSTPPTFGDVNTQGYADFVFMAANANHTHSISLKVNRGVGVGFGTFSLQTRGNGQIVRSAHGTSAKNFQDHSVIGGPTAAYGVVAFRGLEIEGKFLPGNAPGAQKTGYLGIEVGSGYAWLKIQVTNNASGDPASITFVKAADGLYGQIGSDGLEADGVSAIPEPASVASGLGLLALGAAGVREMRRRRAVAA